MNKMRKKEIGRAIDLLSEAKEIIEDVQEQEQEYMDNMPESMQDGEKGMKVNEGLQALGDADMSCEEAIEHLQEIQ